MKMLNMSVLNKIFSQDFNFEIDDDIIKSEITINGATIELAEFIEDNNVYTGSDSLFLNSDTCERLVDLLNESGLIEDINSYENSNEIYAYLKNLGIDAKEAKLSYAIKDYFDVKADEFLA